MNIHLGTNNFFAVKRWPEPEVWVDIIKNKLGLDIVQFNFDLLDPFTPQPTRDLMANKIFEAVNKAELTIQSTYSGGISYQQNLLLHPDTGMRSSALLWFENAMAISGDLQVEVTGALFGSMSAADYANSKRKKFITDCLFDSVAHLSELAKQKGIKYLLWEPSQVPKELPSRIDDVLIFFDRINEISAIPVYFLLDLGHSCNQEVSGDERDPYYWISRLAKISPMIHLQQTDGKFDRHWPFTQQYNDQGIIKAEKVFETLSKAGVDEVHLILETVHPFEANDSFVLDELEQSAAYWKDAIARM